MTQLKLTEGDDPVNYTDWEAQQELQESVKDRPGEAFDIDNFRPPSQGGAEIDADELASDVGSTRIFEVVSVKENTFALNAARALVKSMKREEMIEHAVNDVLRSLDNSNEDARNERQLNLEERRAGLDRLKDRNKLLFWGMVSFVVLAVVGLSAILGAVVFTGVKSGQMADTGIQGGFFSIVMEIVKSFLGG